jgi:hypothetical protein
VSSLAYVLVGGGFQDGGGSPLADGELHAQLLLPCVDLATGTQVICPQALSYALDDNGNVSTSPSQHIIPSNLIVACRGAIGLAGPGLANDPQGTFYMVEVQDENGQTVWGPNALYLNSTDTVLVKAEPLSGVDGANRIFNLSMTPEPANSLYLFLNAGGPGSALLLIPGVDFNLSGTQITLTFSPLVGEAVNAVYYTDAFASPTFADHTFSSGSTVYTLPSVPLAGTLTIYQGGALQSPGGVDYTRSGQTITFGATTFATIYAKWQTAPGLMTTTSEIPSGAVDGSNRVFTLTSNPIPQSVLLSVSGVTQQGTQQGGVDYTLSSGNVITMATAPLSGQNLRVTYNIGGVIDIGQYVPSNPA